MFISVLGIFSCLKNYFAEENERNEKEKNTIKLWMNMKTKRNTRKQNFHHSLKSNGNGIETHLVELIGRAIVYKSNITPYII